MLSRFGREFQTILAECNHELLELGDLSMILEIHGQNEEIEDSLRGYRNFAQVLNERFNFRHIRSFGFAWTWEIISNPKAGQDKDCSLLMSEHGARRLMRSFTKFPRAGLQELCNYQSDLPFVEIENLEETFSIDEVIVSGGASQIYSATRHSMRQTKIAEPYYHGVYSSFFSELKPTNANALSQYNRRLQNVRQKRHENEARAKINSLKNSPKALRLEQVISYDLSSTNEFDITSFLPQHLIRLRAVFGINQKVLSSRLNIDEAREMEMLFQDEELENDEAYKDLRECIHHLVEAASDENETDELELPIYTFLNVPIADLRLILVKHDGNQDTL